MGKTRDIFKKIGRTELNLKLCYFDNLMQRADSLEKTLMLVKTEGKRKGSNREWDSWMASPTQWTNEQTLGDSEGGKPDGLQFIGLQRVGHNLRNWTTKIHILCLCFADCDRMKSVFPIWLIPRTCDHGTLHGKKVIVDFINLRMMLRKCCTQYASKFRKLSSGHRTGKGQFSFQSQTKAMPKNAQTTTQLHSSHMLTKLCSKFSKSGFNSTWSVNFQMFKLDLEKAEEPDIKFRTSTDHQKSKTVPGKHLFLLYWLCETLSLYGSQ